MTFTKKLKKIFFYNFKKIKKITNISHILAKNNKINKKIKIKIFTKKNENFKNTKTKNVNFFIFL